MAVKSFSLSYRTAETAKYWSLGAAKTNCAWNLANNGNTVKVRCTYDGGVIGGNE
jgi:hypothetical protein